MYGSDRLQLDSPSPLLGTLDFGLLNRKLCIANQDGEV
jgi:hypothetical protein